MNIQREFHRFSAVYGEAQLPQVGEIIDPAQELAHITYR